MISFVEVFFYCRGIVYEMGGQTKCHINGETAKVPKIEMPLKWVVITDLVPKTM